GRKDISFRCRAQAGTPRSRRGSTEYRLAAKDNSFADTQALARAEFRASLRCVASPNVQDHARRRIRLQQNCLRWCSPSQSSPGFPPGRERNYRTRDRVCASVHNRLKADREYLPVRNWQGRGRRGRGGFSYATLNWNKKGTISQSYFRGSLVGWFRVIKMDAQIVTARTATMTTSEM